MAMRLGIGVLVVALAQPVPVAIAQDPASEDFARRQFAAAMGFMREQKYNEALKDFQAIVDGYPNSRVADAALLQIATYHLETAGDTAAAQTALDTLLKKYPQSVSAPMAQVLAGRVLVAGSRAAGEIESAQARFARVPQLYPNSDAVPASVFYWGETLRLTHRPEEAVARYRQVSTDYPLSVPWAARALLGEARCLVTVGQWTRAMELLQRVRQRFPDTLEAATALEWNTILYRLYIRPPTQPSYQFASRELAGPTGKLKDIGAIVVDPRGTVYAAGSTSIQPFDAVGKMQPALPAMHPVGLTLDRAARLVAVLEAGLLAGGEAVSFSVPKSDGTPRLLQDVTAGVVTSTGDVLVADKSTRAINRFSAAGKYQAQFAPVYALRLAIDSTDRVAALEEDGGGVAVLDADGRPVTRIPARGQGYQFDRSVDVAFDAFGHVYVLDRNVGAVHVFTSLQPPKLVTSFSIPNKAPGNFRRARAFGLDGAGRLYIYDDDAEKILVYQ